MNLIEQAYAQVPGLQEAETRLKTAKAWHLPPITDALEFVAADLYAAAGSGDPLPDNLYEKISHAFQAEGARITASNLIKELSNRATQEFEALRREGANPALAWLQTQMEALQAAVRKDADVIGGATTAEDALASGPGVAKAWARLSDHVDRYDSIRSVQLTLTRSAFDQHEWAGGPKYNLALAQCGQLADAVHRDASWVAIRMESHRTTTQQTLRGDHLGLDEWLDWLLIAPGTPWQAMPQMQWWPTDDHKAFLLWVMTEAHPWVPTISQLVAAAQLTKIATRAVVYHGDSYGAATEDQLLSSRHAVTDLEALTGIDPKGNPTGKPRHSGKATNFHTVGPRRQPSFI